MKPARAASASEKDIAAARRVQAYFNLLTTDPQLRGEYPVDLVEWYGETWPHEAVVDGDLDTISVPIDFFGMDYYNDFIVRHDPLNATIEPYGANLLLKAETVRVPASAAGMYNSLLWVQDRYGNIPVHLLEIGIPLDDTVDNGSVHDPARIAYLDGLVHVDYEAGRRTVKDSSTSTVMLSPPMASPSPRIHSLLSRSETNTPNP